MGQKLLTRFLCFSLAWSTLFPAHAGPLPPGTDVDALRARYPEAQIIHITAEEYPALESRLLQEGYRPAGGGMLLAANEARNYRFEVDDAASSEPADECRERNRDRTSSEESFRLAFEITDDMMTNRSKNGKGAAVVFVVVGTVVLIVWTLYLFRYLYDASRGGGVCGGWWEFAAVASAGANDEEHARFSGLRYQGGFRDGYTDFGLSAEIGHSDIRLVEEETLDLKGVYWLFGPLLRWRFRDEPNPDYFQMEFLAGSTEHAQMGLIALAKAGLSFGVGNGLRWGVSYGAMNLNLHETDGLITDRSRLYELLGLEFGYRF